MNIVIVHHHLNTGGVTKVIEMQIEALEQEGFKPELLVGSNQSLKRDDLPIHIVPQLNYLSTSCTKPQLDAQLEKIVQAFQTNSRYSFSYPQSLFGKKPFAQFSYRSTQTSWSQDPQSLP